MDIHTYTKPYLNVDGTEFTIGNTIANITWNHNGNITSVADLHITDITENFVIGRTTANPNDERWIPLSMITNIIA